MFFKNKHANIFVVLVTEQFWSGTWNIGDL